VSNSTEKIIELILNGRDNDALSLLYNQVYPKVNRLVVANSGSEDDSKDVFQEAILVFYSNVTNNKYDRIYDVSGFIIRVSRNIWINKAKRAGRQVNSDFIEDYEDNTHSPLVSIIMQEKWAAFQNLFDSLGTKCKEILTYSVYEKLPMKEIAVKMNLTNEHSAKTQNYRCKQKLMELIGGNRELKDLLKS
jgi:RNA polymerase sigma factor (sigma-70 family)